MVHGTTSLKENLDVNESSDVITSSLADGCDTTDISMTESISFDTCSVHDDVQSLTSGPSSKEVSPDHRSLTLPSKLSDGKINERDELDELLQVERTVDSNEKLYQTMPSPLSTPTSPEKQSSSIQSNVACDSSSTQPDEVTKSSDSDENLSKTETDYKSAETAQITTTTDDSSTLTNKTNNDTDEYFTPMNTLKPVDFDDFKRQIREEFIQNSSQLQHLNDNTLKSHQPIDPSRINDSLKLYSENVMSKSMGGVESATLREVPTSVHYQTLNNNKSDCSSSNSINYELKKSGSAAVSSSSDLSASTENGVNRSRSGPNWYRNHQLPANDNDSDGDDDESNSATLKPAVNSNNKRSIHIKMDCYDEIRNGVSSTTSEATTTLTTPTSPFDDDLDDDPNECVVVLRKPRTGSTAIKRRSGNRRWDL